MSLCGESQFDSQLLLHHQSYDEEVIVSTCRLASWEDNDGKVL